MTEVTESVHINIILPQETRKNPNKQPNLTPIEQLEKEQTKPKVSSVQFSSVQSLSHVWLFATPMDCSTPGLPVLHQLPELTQTHVHWVGDATQPSHLLSSLLLPSVFPSIRVFSNESTLRISRVQLLATPWTAAYQAPASMGFSRQEYWSGVPLPSPNPRGRWDKSRESSWLC